MRTGRGRGKGAPSSPSVDALAAIAARKAAKMEKSLNKVPAMQLIADQLAGENAMKARPGIEPTATIVEAPTAAETVSMESDANSDDESAASVHGDTPTSTLAQMATDGQSLAPVEAQQPSSTQATYEDVDMVDADILADFDLDSGSEKDFFREQLRIAPPEEVEMLLSSLKRTAKPTIAPIGPTPTDRSDEATQSLLKHEVADFAQKRAAAMPQGVPTKEQLSNFKEEVYTYGIGLNLGETQALLAAAKAEADVVKSRSLNATKSRLVLPGPPIDAMNKTIEHLTKIQDAVGELFKDAPQLQAETKPASANTPTANKRKRGRPSKGGAEVAKTSETTESAADAASKRQKTSPEAAVQIAPVVTTELAVAASEPPKLTRKQKQELYRQELEKKRPVIAKKVAPATASTIPAPMKTLATTTVAQPPAPPSTAPNAPTQKTRQRARKSGPQKQLEKATKSVVGAATPAAIAVAPIAPKAATEEFVDLRAPKKRKRGRKSTGPVGEAADNGLPAPNASGAAIVPEKEILVADKPATATSEPLPNPASVQSSTKEGENDNKNKSKRQNKTKKRKSLSNVSAPAAAAGTTIVATPSKAVEAAAQAEQPAVVKQTPILPPSRVILPPKHVSAQASLAKATAATTRSPATSILPTSI